MNQRGEKDGGGDVLKLPPIDPSIYVLAQPTLAPPRPNVIDEAVVLKVDVGEASMHLNFAKQNALECCTCFCHICASVTNFYV